VLLFPGGLIEAWRRMRRARWLTRRR
jgi:hypothetical protein